MKIFVLSHDERLLARAPTIASITKVNLIKLSGRFHSNLLGEGRAFLVDHDTGGADYVGFTNARWDFKYDKLGTRLDRLPFYVDRAISAKVLTPTTVLAPWPTDCRWLDVGNDWYGYTLSAHHGMRALLVELSELTGMSLCTGRRSLWANDFICHRSVYHDFIAHWRKCFQHFHGRYGHMLPFESIGTDVARHAAYFYERCGTIFWANRSDLEVLPIP